MAAADPPATDLAAGDEIEVVIDSLAAGGDGVGRLADGRVVFVPFTAPGDRVRARIRSRRARFARAEVTERLEDGPGRAVPACGAFGDCGGCQWQHLDYAIQAEAKRRIAEDALRRVGRLEPTAPVGLVPSPLPYRYRARARVAVSAGAVGFRRRKSREICAVRECPILTAPVEAELAALADAPPTAGGEWELAAGRRQRVGESGPLLELEVAGDRLRLSAGVFFQAHAGLHRALHGSVIEAAGRGGLALELYSGAGFFSLALARRFERLVAVESDPVAVADLRHNLGAAGLTRVDVCAERVEVLLASDTAAVAGADAVVLDPPRAGLPSGAAEALAALGPERIVYLSCDPATLARDLARLASAGYRLDAATVFDLFPQTSHVEVLASLSPASSRVARPAAGAVPLC